MPNGGDGDGERGARMTQLGPGEKTIEQNYGAHRGQSPKRQEERFRFANALWRFGRMLALVWEENVSPRVAPLKTGTLSTNRVVVVFFVFTPFRRSRPVRVVFL